MDEEMPTHEVVIQTTNPQVAERVRAAIENGQFDQDLAGTYFPLRVDLNKLRTDGAYDRTVWSLVRDPDEGI